MLLGNPIDSRVPWIRRISDLEDARSKTVPGTRLKALRAAGEVLGDALRGGPRVVSVRTLPISTLIYPTKYAFQGACPLPFPFVQMNHRALLVQVLAEGVLRNVLFNPTDREASRATPFFKQIIDAVGEPISRRMVVQGPTLEQQLRDLGVPPEHIDVLAFDHFHTQDLRPIVGTASLPARFPNAVLLAPRTEWDDWDDLHPMHAAWFVKDGKQGVDATRVVTFDADLALGDGCVLLRTAGHTRGNQTIFVHGEEGVFGCSENGTSADNWSPHDSRIPGLSRHARNYGVDVILNANTPELAGEQYISMVLERSVASRVKHAPAFVQMFPSSEVTSTPIAPGIKPTLVFGHRDSGRVARRARVERSVAAAAE